MDYTIDNFEIGNDTTEGVEHRIEDECLERRLRISLWMRDALNHRIQDILDTLTCLA